jgi:molybdopterin synthase sulfurtransferase
MTSTHEQHPGTGHGHRPIDAAELRGLLSDPDTTIVDVRPSAAYNGWRLNGERRGGHIPGAVSFPHAWIDRLDDAEAMRLLASKGVLGHRTVVVYGHDAWDAWTFALKVEGWGHAVRIYEAGWAEWSDDDSLPVDRLPNFQRLIHPEWLRDLIDGGRPEAYAGNRFGVFHVNFGVPEEYADGHLPGALYLDTNRLEDAADWNRRSPEELEATLRALGITHDTTVVLYGRDTAGGANEKWPGRRAGQIAATRAAAILHYAGVDDIRVLDGGFDAWVTRGHPLEVVDRQPTPVSAFGVTIPQRPETIVDIGEAKAILADPDGAALVSVRSWREHIGAVSGYNYIGPAGRIAGDVWGNCGSDAYHMQHYRSVDNTMRAYPEIAANWAEAGITPDKWVAFYCGTGWRASETWFYAHLMGWERIAVYDGGWLEWSADPDQNPIVIGEPDRRAAPDEEYAA